jgi:hypothetical protein
MDAMPRHARLAASLAVLALASSTACGPSTFGDYPRSPVVVAPLDARPGWSAVEEPGWFSATMPGAPKTDFESIAVTGGRAEVKGVIATDQRSVWTWIRYFEVNAITSMLDPDTLLRAGRDDFMSLEGVRFLRDEPRAPGGPALDFVCAVAPRSPLDLSDQPMFARVRAYERRGGTSRVIFAIAVWPAATSDEAARAFFEGLRVKG